MKYKITSAYCNLKDCGVVLMYMIEGTPFTFEEEGFDYTDPEIIAEAMLNPELTLDQMYQWSCYLILEGMHPIVYDLEEQIANPSMLPE